MTTRDKNERKFENWIDLDNGGRRYWFEINGRNRWKARYNKVVDEDENTVRFYQEIFDATGALREIHHKFPVDLGHQDVKDEGDDY